MYIFIYTNIFEATLKIISIIAILLLISCGDKNTYQVNEVSTISNDNENTQSSEDNNRSSQDDVQLSTSVLAPSAIPFIGKRFSIKNTSDLKYVDFSYQRVSDTSQFNNIEFKEGPRYAKLNGIKLVINEGNRLYTYLANNLDIKILEINAEEVVINSKIWLPSTNVTINAKKLIIGPLGSLSTTPTFLPDNANSFEDGRKGLKAGDIKLNISKLDIRGHERVIFNLIGGKGQDAGPGKDGRNGSIPGLNDLGDGVVYKQYATQIVEDINPRNPNRFFTIPVSVRVDKEIGKKQWPQDGGDAVSGGRPGIGGDGGNLLSRISIESKYFTSVGGKSGKRAPDYKGGAAGLPNPAIHEYWVSGKLRQRQIKEFRPGKDIDSPKAKKEFGNDGRYKLLETTLGDHWLTNGYLANAIKYGKDLFLGNHVVQAHSYFLKLSQFCTDFTSEDVVRTNHCLSILSNLQNLNLGNNYFGNSLNNVPLISLETSTSIYKNELLNALEVIYFATLSKSKKLDTKDKLRILSNLQDSIYKELEKSNNQIPKLLWQIPDVNTLIDELRRDEKVFTAELLRVQAIIEQRARDNIIDRRRKAKLSKVLKSIATVASVIPVGKPALGASVEALTSFIDKGIDSNSLSDTIKNVSGLYKAVKKIEPTIAKSKEDWNNGFQKIRYSVLRDKLDEENKREERNKILETYMKDITKFAYPIVENTLAEINSYRKISYPKDEVEKEILRLQQTDPMFNELTLLLNNILENRKSAAQKVRQINSRVSKIMSDINEGFNKIANISNEKFLLLERNTFLLGQDFESIIDDAKYRILFYNYNLYSSYQYRLFNNEEVGFYESLSSIIEKMENDILMNDGNESSDLMTYYRLNQDNLSKIFFKSINSLRSEELINDSTTIHLNDAQIRELNKGNEIFLNLYSIKDHFSGQENLKIRDVTIDTDFNDSYSDQSISKFLLTIEHGNDHIIEKNGITYKLGQERTYEWGVSVDTISGHHSVLEPSKLNYSFLERLIGEDLSENEASQFYARPSLLGEYKVKFINKSYPKTQIDLKEVSIKIEYDYMKKN